MNDKKLYVIAGCNGAGKTTASLQRAIKTKLLKLKNEVIALHYYSFGFKILSWLNNV